MFLVNSMFNSHLAPWKQSERTVRTEQRRSEMKNEMDPFYVSICFIRSLNNLLFLKHHLRNEFSSRLTYAHDALLDSFSVDGEVMKRWKNLVLSSLLLIVRWWKAQILARNISQLYA